VTVFSAQSAVSTWLRQRSIVSSIAPGLASTFSSSAFGARLAQQEPERFDDDGVHGLVRHTAGPRGEQHVDGSNLGVGEHVVIDAAEYRPQPRGGCAVREAADLVVDRSKTLGMRSASMSASSIGPVVAVSPGVVVVGFVWFIVQPTPRASPLHSVTCGARSAKRLAQHDPLSADGVATVPTSRLKPRAGSSWRRARRRGRRPCRRRRLDDEVDPPGVFLEVARVVDDEHTG
jgi:hypothetical protein